LKIKEIKNIIFLAQRVRKVRYEVIFMLVNTKDLISLTEANQNFSKVARTVDEKGSVIIMKNNAPHYIVIDFKKL